MPHNLSYTPKSICKPFLDAAQSDWMIRNAKILDTRNGQLIEGDVTVRNGTISGIFEGGYPVWGSFHGKSVDAEGQYLVPGLVNTHLHIESSLITPQEYSRMTLPRGTTTVICDPHEAANVVGTKAFDFFLDSAARSIQDIWVGLSSCVPATPLGTSGANIDATALIPYMDRPGVIGLAEMMNIGGMMGDDPVVVDKLNLFTNRYIGGHMPGISDPDMLNKFYAFGIQDDHECTTAAEAEIKLDVGLNIMIREGTAAKNLDALLPIIKPSHRGRMMFCTDDRHPDEIEDDGEIDYIVRKAIAGYDPDMHGPDKAAYTIFIYQMATLWAAENFGLKDRGAIEPGMKADLLLIPSLEECRPSFVMKDGVVIKHTNNIEPKPRIFDLQTKVDPDAYGLWWTIHFKGRDKITKDDFVVTSSLHNEGLYDTVPSYPVIQIIPGQIVTQYSEYSLPLTNDNEIQADPQQDILKLAVIERHGKSEGDKGNIRTGFVKGFELKSGAIGSSVGHDDHNITIVGANDEDMAVAANALRDAGGGFVFVENGKVQVLQPLPLAGLMSGKPGEEVATLQRQFLKAVEGKTALHDPTMTLAFLTLSVIPDIKLSDKVGYTRFNPSGGIPVPVALGQ